MWSLSQSQSQSQSQAPGLGVLAIAQQPPCVVLAGMVRVRVEIMGLQKCRIVGKSEAVLIMINPIIFTRTRISAASGLVTK
jgi:hypothetical protein